MATTTAGPTITVVCGECDEGFPVDRDLLLSGGDWMTCPVCHPTRPTPPADGPPAAETPE